MRNESINLTQQETSSKYSKFIGAFSGVKLPLTGDSIFSEKLKSKLLEHESEWHMDELPDTVDELAEKYIALCSAISEAIHFKK